MTDNTLTQSDTQPVFLDAEICDTIADLIAFGVNREFYDCACQTSDGTKVQVDKGYVDSGRGIGDQEFFRIRVWDQQDDDGNAVILLETIVQKYDLAYVLSLKNQSEEVSAKRKELDAQDTILARDEIDLETLLVAAVLALCVGSED